MMNEFWDNVLLQREKQDFRLFKEEKKNAFHTFLSKRLEKEIEASERVAKSLQFIDEVQTFKNERARLKW